MVDSAPRMTSPCRLSMRPNSPFSGSDAEVLDFIRRIGATDDETGCEAGIKEVKRCWLMEWKLVGLRS